MERRKQKAKNLVQKLSNLLDYLNSISYSFNSKFKKGIEIISELNASNDLDTVISKGKNGLTNIISGLKDGQEDCRKDMITNGVCAAANVAFGLFSPMGLLNLVVGGGSAGVVILMKKTKEKIEEAISKAEGLLSEFNSSC